MENLLYFLYVTNEVEYYKKKQVNKNIKEFKANNNKEYNIKKI